MSKSVLVANVLPAEALALIPKDVSVDYHDSLDALPRSELMARIRGKDGLICHILSTVDDELLAAAPTVKVVANVAVGYNNIDVAAARRRGVVVTNTPDVLTETTADFAWALLMASGTRRALGFNMRVLYQDAVQADAAVERDLRASRVDLETLLRESDFVSLHTPFLPETRHLMNARTLRLMKRSAILVNAARGPVVEEAALVRALREGWIAAAGLDVFEEEPKVHPGLLSLTNVVMAPHIGSASLDTRIAMATLAVRNVLAVLDGKPPITPVS